MACCTSYAMQLRLSGVRQACLVIIKTSQVVQVVLTFTTLYCSLFINRQNIPVSVQTDIHRYNIQIIIIFIIIIFIIIIIILISDDIQISTALPDMHITFKTTWYYHHHHHHPPVTVHPYPECCTLHRILSPEMHRLTMSHQQGYRTVQCLTLQTVD